MELISFIGVVRFFPAFLPFRPVAAPRGGSAMIAAGEATGYGKRGFYDRNIF
jgi:hypothetical protein